MEESSGERLMFSRFGAGATLGPLIGGVFTDLAVCSVSGFPLTTSKTKELTNLSHKDLEMVFLYQPTRRGRRHRLVLLLLQYERQSKGL